MQLNMERIMIFMQRRYNSMCEIGRLTGDLLEAVNRGDQVSATMLLQMRAEEMDKFSVVTEQIWEMSSAGLEEENTVRRLMTSDPSEGLSVTDPTEKKIFEIRQKTVAQLERIREMDRRINQRAGGEKSYYASGGK